MLSLQRKCQKLSDTLRIKVGKYFSCSFSVASCNYLKRSESVEHVRKNSVTEKCNTKSSSSGSPGEWGREREFCFCFLSDLITGCFFFVVCLEQSRGFDLNLRALTQIAWAFSVIREEGVAPQAGPSGMSLAMLQAPEPQPDPEPASLLPSSGSMGPQMFNKISGCRRAFFQHMLP